MTGASPPAARVALEAPARGAGPPDALVDALQRAVDAQPAAPEAPVGAVLALDAGGLARARAAGVPVRVALLAGLSVDLPGGLDDATHALVADAALAAYLTRPGLVVASVGPLVAGPLVAGPRPPAPPERHGAPSAPAAEPRGAGEGVAAAAPAGLDPRAELRRTLGLPDGARVVALREPELRDLGMLPVLLQLELCATPPALWIDVGDDDGAASRVRAALPGHALDAWVVGGQAWAEALSAADLALVWATGRGASDSLALGTPVLALPAEEGRAERAARAALAALASPRPPAALATLAVALDAALAGDAPDRARAALAARDLAGGPARAVAYAAQAISDTPGPRRSTRVGVPNGFERVAWREDAQARGAEAAPSSGSASSGSASSVAAPADAAAGPTQEARSPRTDAELDAQVEAELAALKARLGRSTG